MQFHRSGIIAKKRNFHYSENLVRIDTFGDLPRAMTNWGSATAANARRPTKSEVIAVFMVSPVLLVLSIFVLWEIRSCVLLKEISVDIELKIGIVWRWIEGVGAKLQPREDLDPAVDLRIMA